MEQINYMGFTYNGLHSSSMGVYYVPDATARGQFFSDYETLANERSWNPGGFYYKARVTTKVFDLQCFYDRLTLAQREKIVRWLDRRTKGYLIFDERPYARYYVHPTKKIEVNDYCEEMNSEGGLYSGTFTITFSAYHPFAELAYDTLSDEITHNKYAMAETGLITPNIMPPTYNAETGLYEYVESEFNVYNPGTETGNSIIEFEGSTGSSPLTIRNVTTGDICIIKAGVSTNTDECYRISSKTGRVEKVTPNSVTLDFSVHDRGYITFAPAYHHIDGHIRYDNGSRVITSAEPFFTEDVVGMYIFAGRQWRYIAQVNSPTEAVVSTNIDYDSTSNTLGVAKLCEIVLGSEDGNGNENTVIVTMNYMEVTFASDANIQRLEVKCKAEVR